MNVGALLTDLTVLGVFLLIGFMVRERIRPLQRIFLASSIIGGVILLILGPQLLHLVPVPQTFSKYSGALIRFIMCALVFGGISKDKLLSYADYMMVVLSVYGMQTFIGIALGIMTSSIWSTLPEGWGFLAVQSFYGGHGTASAAGAVFKGVTQINDYIDLGIVMSTFGIIIAMTIGMVVVNYGVRKGWATFVKEVAKQPPTFYGGLLPNSEQKAIGTQKVTSSSINALALQLGFVLASMWIGEFVGRMVAWAFPVLKAVSAIAWDTLGGILGWYFFDLIGMTKFVDKKTIGQLSGLALEILLLGAMSTLNLTVLANNIIPILIMTFVVCGLTIFWALFMARMTCKDQWFEKAIMIVGQSTGATPTGMALVRAVDPDGHACSPEAHGIYSGVTFWTYFFTSLFPLMLIQGNYQVPFAVGVVLFLVPVAIGFLVFRPIMLRSRNS